MIRILRRRPARCPKSHTVYLHPLCEYFVSWCPVHVAPAKYDSTHHLLHLSRGYLGFGLDHSHGLADGFRQSVADLRVEGADPVCIRHHGSRAPEGGEGRPGAAEVAVRSLCNLAARTAGTLAAEERRHSGQDTEHGWRRLPWVARWALEDREDSMHHPML